jgi:hypothetical protein
MKPTQLTAIFIILLLAISVSLHSYPGKATAQTRPDVYLGIDAAFGDFAATKQLIDKVSAYTNLFVVGCTGITYNASRLNEICQYLFDRNMSFIVFTCHPIQPSQQWYEMAKNMWGSSFLGIYVDDELGGKQLDQSENYVTVPQAANYSDAENQYQNRISYWLNYFSTYTNATPMFTSDYALYWFDYKAGYNTVFAEFGWNISRQLNVALCRGAATAQNKEWGVMITWTYWQPPYIESGEELYKDMVLAYDNGAKYIIIFDSNENYAQSILKEEHLSAIEQFWQYAQANPRNSSPTSERVAYVLPESYAYGFRGPKDKIWGLWEADAFSYVLSVGSHIMLDQYGPKLDMIYEDAIQGGNTCGYGNIIYWNDPTQVEESWPPDGPIFPFPTESPSSIPTPTLTPNPTVTPSAPSASPTVDPTMSPEATATPAHTEDLENGFLLFGNYFYAVAGAAVIVGAAVAAAFFRKKRQPY